MIGIPSGWEELAAYLCYMRPDSFPKSFDENVRINTDSYYKMPENEYDWSILP